MIPWYGHQTFISTTWKVSTSGVCGLSSPSSYSKIIIFQTFCTFQRYKIISNDCWSNQIAEKCWRRPHTWASDQMVLMLTFRTTWKRKLKWLHFFVVFSPFYCKLSLNVQTLFALSGDMRSRLWRLPVQQAHVPCQCKSLVIIKIPELLRNDHTHCVKEIFR